MLKVRCLRKHLQQAWKVFHMNWWILQDGNVCIVKRLPHFESVVSSVACFAGGHRTMYTRQLERLDTHCRKLCRSIVGPPRGTGRTLEWHEILHQWNVRVNLFIDTANIKTWSRICFSKLLEVSATFRHPIARALGSTKFYVGARMEQSELGAHIFMGSRILNRTAGTMACGNGRMLL